MKVDLEVERLCKIDGGVQIFEHADPPREFLRDDGTIDLQTLAAATPSQSYYLRREGTYVKPDAPVIVRMKESLYRGGDNKLLGVAIAYIRPMDHSAFPPAEGKMCPEGGAGLPLVTSVFRTKATNF